MDDLISRQQAIDALNDAVHEHNITDFDAVATILALPPVTQKQVDVAEVVRCKDCAHYDGQWCYWNGHYLKDYDFCSRAERIKGDTE